jgi:predicted phosphodiesterase
MRALILSDIHANLEALEAVLASAANLPGKYDQIWNLGDLVGYGGSPNQVIERVRPLEHLVVRGNHDRVCCGLTSPNGFNPVARAAALWTRTELNPDNIKWLRELPQGPLAPDCAGVTCAHGSPLDEDQYILNMRDAWAPLQQMTTAITFFGHTHVQGGFSQREHDWHELRPAYGAWEKNKTDPETDKDSAPSNSDASYWVLAIEPGTRHLINPGSVGQPRDRDWRAAFAIYDSGDSAKGATPTPTITFHRVPYDLVASQGRILMAGLPERLAMRLREGR